MKSARTPDCYTERPARGPDESKVIGALTTHVLDTMRGSPAAGMDLCLYRLDPEPTLLVTTRTNADGRCDAPLLSGDDFLTGRYRLEFAVGDYFAGAAVESTGSTPNVPFLDRVPVDFLLQQDGGHYHVPLLVSPFSYTTYRGS